METTMTRRQLATGLPRGVLTKTARRLGVPINTLWYRVHIAKDGDALAAILATIEEIEARRAAIEENYRRVIAPNAERGRDDSEPGLSTT